MFASCLWSIAPVTRNTDDTWSSTKAYLKHLQSNPLRTKMLTSGSLFALQELLASWIAQDRSKHGHYFNSRIPKMAIYGAFISAPLGHFLIGILQRVFAGRTSLKAKILQILASNLIVRRTLLEFPSTSASLADRADLLLHRSRQFRTSFIWRRWPSLLVRALSTRSRLRSRLVSSA